MDSEEEEREKATTNSVARTEKSSTGSYPTGTVSQGRSQDFFNGWPWEDFVQKVGGRLTNYLKLSSIVSYFLRT